MTLQLNPYLTFDGTCAEAMDFYAAALGGTVRTMTFRDAGMEIDGVMHSALETPEGFHLYASDIAPQSMPHQPGNNVQVSISGDDAEALRRYWSALSEGAQVMMPLERQMWGDEYGMLQDRFGILWHVNIDGSAA